MIFIYPKLHHHPFRVYNEPIQRPAPSWLVSLIGRALHLYRRVQWFEFHTSLIFFRLSFRNCKRCVYNYDDHPSFNKNNFVIFSCTYRDLDELTQSRNQVNVRRGTSPLNLGWDQKKNREGYLSLKVPVHFLFSKNLNINCFIIPPKHAYLNRW